MKRIKRILTLLLHWRQLCLWQPAAPRRTSPLPAMTARRQRKRSS